MRMRGAAEDSAEEQQSRLSLAQSVLCCRKKRYKLLITKQFLFGEAMII